MTNVEVSVGLGRETRVDLTLGPGEVLLLELGVDLGVFSNLVELGQEALLEDLGGDVRTARRRSDGARSLGGSRSLGLLAGQLQPILRTYLLGLAGSSSLSTRLGGGLLASEELGKGGIDSVLEVGSVGPLEVRGTVLDAAEEGAEVSPRLGRVGKRGNVLLEEGGELVGGNVDTYTSVRARAQTGLKDKIGLTNTRSLVERGCVNDTTVGLEVLDGSYGSALKYLQFATHQQPGPAT